MVICRKYNFVFFLQDILYFSSIIIIFCNSNVVLIEKYILGATDSAVPCAMMLNLAYVMKKELDQIKDNIDVSLKLIFFDGEEAFDKWGPKDSIYGAKHLANKWQRSSRLTTENEVVTDLNRIDVLVLLDLIGVRNPKFYCFFPQTQRW